jgi:hypothetical protein
MKLVKVSEEHWASVDDADYALVAAYVWRLRMGGKNRYAVTIINGREVFMHRLIMDAAKGTIVDHIDGESLNNQRANLRFCTRAENFRNAGHRQTPGRTSQYKGVWRVKDRCRRCWRSGITVNRVYKNIGSYWTEEEAARAYDAEANLLHGQFARLNFPPRGSKSGARASNPSPAPRPGDSAVRGTIRSRRKGNREHRRSRGAARPRRSGPKSDAT